MSKTLLFAFLILSCYISISNANNDDCSCHDEGGFWSFDTLYDYQRVSDFFIAVAYFSIPIELIYFVSCSHFPFKWILFQFIAFIVLCGMTHLLHSWTYRPHPFELMLAVTIFKILTALVSFATAITLVTLIPLLLKVKVREFMLMKKTWDLDREVELIKKQNERGLHARMLTHEIRKSLDRHAILYTTLVELSKTLNLQNCAIWMPNTERTEMSLTHELTGRNFSHMEPIPTSDPGVREVKRSKEVKILDPQSALAIASCLRGTTEPGSVAAIRMPMLKVANFKGGTPEMVPACYAILVCVLPDEEDRNWTRQELEIVEVVADQVAVALSHVAILEESQLMREKLGEQNHALQQAREDALTASQARISFQMEMSDGLRRPMHSILGLLSFLQDDENLRDEQRLIINSMVKTGNILATLTSDIMDTLGQDSGRFPIEIRPFSVHTMIKEAACVSKCLCSYMGCDFIIDIDKSMPNLILGDERRVFQVIFHMAGNTLNEIKGGGCLTLRVYTTSGSPGWNEHIRNQFRATSYGGYVFIKFEVGLRFTGSKPDCTRPNIPYGGQRFNGAIEESMSFKACQKLVQLMQGDMWVIPNPEDFDQCMALLLRFQIQPSAISIPERGGISDNAHRSNSLCRGIRVLLADSDDTNRGVTRKLLEKLGCNVSAVSSGFECLDALASSISPYQIVILDLHLPDMDGFEVSMRIRKLRSCHNWPLIVALTSNDDDDGDVRDKCLQIGMNGVIRKPGLFQVVASEMKRILLQASMSLT